MTMPKNEAAGHARRAAAILVHFANKDVAGFNAIASEVKTADDTIRLILALVGMFEMALPMLLTPTGIAITQRTIADLAGMQYQAPS